jgi:hypothetical protein
MSVEPARVLAAVYKIVRARDVGDNLLPAGRDKKAAQRGGFTCGANWSYFKSFKIFNPV